MAASVSSFVSRYLPGVATLGRYPREWLTADVLAGLTLWAILVPQALAYAGLAKVPPVIGLYTALGATLLHFFLGTSRELNVGPESTIAILVATIVTPLADGDDELYLGTVAALAILTGLVALIGGLFRLGWITRFLSRPILLGYIPGSAVIIIVSQLTDLLGVDVSDSDAYFGLGAIVRSLDEVNLWTLGLGLGTIVVVLRRINRRIPSYLIAMAVATAAVAVFDLTERGVSVIGEIQSGLPAIGLPGIGMGHVFSLVGPAFAVALLMYADSLLTEQPLAKINDYEVDPNQEFLALRAANIGSGLVGGFAANGSQSRSVVDTDAGAKSQVSSLAAGALVVLTLLLLTPLFENLPNAALAGVVLVAAFSSSTSPSCAECG